MSNKLVHHSSVRATKIYDGSIRNPRTGIDDNKSVGLKFDNVDQTISLFFGVGKYLLWNMLRRLSGSGDAALLITSYKYNKGPSGHATTLTSSVKK